MYYGNFFMQSTPNHSKRWLTVPEAAQYLNFSKSALDKDRLTGLLGIPFTRLGKKILYDLHDLDRYLEANKVSWQIEGAA